jgi:hypothetical protein
MIIELSTNFSDMEKNWLKQWADVDVKLYIDLNKLVESFYFFDKEKNIVTDNLENKTIETPSMMPNRIICVDLRHWFVERKNEPGLWYVGFRRADGTIICYDKYDDLKTAFNDSKKRKLKMDYNIAELTREEHDRIEKQIHGRYPYNYFIICDVDINKKYRNVYFRELYIEAKLSGVKVSENIANQWRPEIDTLKTFGYHYKNEVAYIAFIEMVTEMTGLGGITIIPPTSLSDFKTILHDTIWKCTEPDKTKFGVTGDVPMLSDFEMAIDIYVTETLIKLIEQAQVENKFIIHWSII